MIARLPQTSDNTALTGKLVSEPAPIFDLVIAGAGASGLALAAAVKQAMGAGVSIALVDPAPPPAADATQLRTVAIAEGPRRLLERVGAWRAIGPKAQAIREMAIMDGRTHDAVRPPHLHFEAKSGEPLAHMAFNDDLVGALAALCERLEVQRFRASVVHWSPGKRAASLGLQRRPLVARAPCGRRRRRAVEARRACGRRDRRLGLRPGRHRRHHRP